MSLLGFQDKEESYTSLPHRASQDASTASQLFPENLVPTEGSKGPHPPSQALEPAALLSWNSKKASE